MTQRNSLLQPLFKAVRTYNPITEEKLSELRALIKDIQSRTAQGEAISIDDPDFAGGNVYNYAAQFNHLGLVDELIKANVNPNIKSSAGDAPLHWAMNDHTQMIHKLLVEAKADPDSQQRSGNTPLINAKDNKELVELLLNNKATPDIQNNEGDTALIIAARKGREEIVRLLLKAKANPDIQNRYKTTALMAAVEKSNATITQLLLDAGAETEIGYDHSITALDRAITLKLFSLRDRFDNGIDLTDNLSVIHALLQHGALIHHPEWLFELLTYCDARDPNVVSTLFHLHEYLIHQPLLKSLLDQTTQYIEKLNHLIQSQKKEFMEIADLAMNPLFPTDLKNIVYSYAPPLERLRLFTLNNDPLAEKKTHSSMAEEKIVVPVPKKTCSVM